jgi:hypothetical protein
MRNLGLAVFSAVFCATLVGACSASGNDPTGAGDGPGSSDSGAAADTSYTYEAGSSSSTTYDSGSTTATPIDSGAVVPFDSGPDPTSNDCDLGGSNAETYITDLGGGSLPPCGTDDACGAGMCCINLTGSIPSTFSTLLAALGGGLPTGGCVAE